MKAKKSHFFVLLGLIIGICLIAVFGIGDTIKGAGKMRFGIDIRGGVEAVFKPQDLDRQPTNDELQAARSVIETRLDAKKILEREVTVDKQKGYIIVRFPWKSDEVNFNPEEAISELGETAQLTFRDSKGNVLLEGSAVKSSKPGFDQSKGEYVVELSFDESGSKLFAEATEKLVGQPLAIYMDEDLISAPIVQEKIEGGQCVINRISGIDEAKALSEKINAGALPFSMNTSNHSSISPTLGSKALNIMVIAGVAAFILVCLFMIVYYKLPGTMSSLALCLQMALQLLVISVPQFTLTLPGIAGIILSLGMAVDANIIISERICEEIAKGLTIRQAIKRGYERAFTSVFDGNFTSAIVAILLMVFGSGSMLSFGYTLLTGLIINFIAGILVSKILLSSIILFKGMNQKKWFREKKIKPVIPFYKKRKIAFILSIVLIVIGILSCLVKGVKLDTQFAGGAVLKYDFNGQVDTAEVSRVVEQVVNRSVNAQITTQPVTKEEKLVLTLAGNEGLTPDKQKEILRQLEKVVEQKKDQAENVGQEKAKIKLAESYVVEPYIGQTALRKSALAIGLSGLFIVCYVWVRFKNLSGLSAGVMSVLALLHDIMIVFFVFVWFGIPLNDAYVAVTLTIIGYSINDTIILYDRIRENSQSHKKKDLGDLISESITQTLSRSVNTSITTVVCVLSILIFSILYGIESIKVFALPMLFGLISGCYSSVCVAGPLWARWQEYKNETLKKIRTSKKNKKDLGKTVFGK